MPRESRVTASIPKTGPSQTGVARPMVAADGPAVGRLFRKIFRGADQDADEDLLAFLHDLTFGSPSYEVQAGSFVFEKPDGGISSALLAVPMRFVVCDRIVTGRMMFAFMTEGAPALGGAGALSLGLRARQQDFTFTDTASPGSMKHFHALGGMSVPLQNLGWVRTFRPIGATLDRVSHRVFRRKGSGPAWLARPLDTLLRARLRRVAAPAPAGLQVETMTIESFLDHAPALIAHYAIHPLWSREELGWLLAMARQNKALGSLSIMAVMDPSNRLIGCFVFYADGRKIAQVLNVLALAKRETDVLDAMFHTFDRLGFVEARGRAQTALMEGLALQAMVTFHHDAFVCVATRHRDGMDAIRRGDIYIGGLAAKAGAASCRIFNRASRPDGPSGRNIR